MSVAARNTWVGRVLVEELARLRTPLVCLAPGARCAPLSMALGATDRVPWATFVDERAAAFHALGVGRATGRPAAVVTTSGTAVGNLVPAAMEADSAGVPLVLLTADRPAELRRTGSNQTVQQSTLLSPLLRDHLDLPCSDPGLPLTGLLSALDHAVHQAIAQRGPVQLNLQFREPLGPADGPVPTPVQAWWTDPKRTPWAAVGHTPGSAPEPTVARLRRLATSARGLVVVGSLPHGAETSVQAVVRALGWPVHATADARLYLGGRGLDSALANPELAARLMPDTVLWFGDHIVSKRIVGWLREAPDTLHLVSVRDRDSRIDPAFRVRERIVVDYGALASAGLTGAPDPGWLHAWDQVDAAAAGVLSSMKAQWSELSAMDRVLAASTDVVVGASLPIRLADWLGPATYPVRVIANRGASGIDGVIATAAGWARCTPGRTRVVVGDLTCLHDQGSLGLVRALGLQAVVFNNRGGSIFGMLPFGQVQAFDRVFRNAHEQGLAPLARACGLRVAEVADLDALDQALADDAVDFIEAAFAHDATIDAVRGLHQQIGARLRATWGLP